MIELFAELISKQERLSIASLIESSMKNDRYIRNNASMTYVVNKEIKASESFFCLEDDYASVKQEVYLSYLTHKILLSMKRFHIEYDHAHVVIVCEDNKAMDHILEDQILRVVSQIQDAEYRITEKQPRVFVGKPSIRKTSDEGYNTLILELPSFGKITMINFESNRRNIDQSNVIRHLLNNELNEYEKVTHFYKLDTVFRERYSSPNASFEDSCKRILEECMPMDSIHYTFTSKKQYHRDTYASRNAIPLALQLNESNKSLMRELIMAIYKSGKIMVIESKGCILDPISSPVENLPLCSAGEYSELIRMLDAQKEDLRKRQTGAVRGQRLRGLWIDESRDFSPIGAPSQPYDDIGSVITESLEEAARASMNAMLNPIFRYDAGDPDGDSYSIQAIPVNPNQGSRNERVYSEDTFRNAFLRQWS